MSKYTSNSFLPYKLRGLLVLVIKLAIVFGAGFFIYNKLMYNDNLKFKVFVNTLTKFQILTLKNGSFLLLLTAINWLLESLKWKVLVSPLQPISIIKAIAHTLGSLTASVFTPNRIGEYGAKAIYFQKPQRKKIVGYTLIGNLAQLLTTLIFGVIGFWLFVREFNPSISYYRMVKIGIFVLLFGYLFLTNTPKSRFKIKGYTFTDLKRFLKSIKQQTILNVLLISVLRYVIFSHQFYFLLLLFNLKISYGIALILISSMYVIVSIIPTIFILDLLVKGSVALWLFSVVNANEVIILSVIVLMWILNFAIPSILGSYYVLTFKPNQP